MRTFCLAALPLRHYKVDSTQGVLDGKLHRYSEGDPDVQLAAVEVGVDEVVAGEVVLGVRVEVEVLEGRLHRLVKTDPVDPELLALSLMWRRLSREGIRVSST